jgi:hypothetical protein
MNNSILDFDENTEAHCDYIVDNRYEILPEFKRANEREENTVTNKWY